MTCVDRVVSWLCEVPFIQKYVTSSSPMPFFDLLGMYRVVVLLGKRCLGIGLASHRLVDLNK